MLRVLTDPPPPFVVLPAAEKTPAPLPASSRMILATEATLRARSVGRLRPAFRVRSHPPVGPLIA